jgi:hypothetical protein
VYATSAGATAADGDGRNGLFTGELFKNIKTPGLEVNDIFRRTGSDVRRASADKQVPAIYSQHFENAYFLPPVGVPTGTVVGVVDVSAVTTPAAPTPAAAATSPRDTSQSENVFAGVWNGTVTYSEGGKNYRDRYTITLNDDSSCAVTIQAQENGKTIMQEGEGSWSFTDTVFRLECDFWDAAIPRLEAVKWTSLYELENGRRLVLLVKPTANFNGTVKVTLTKKNI